MIRNAPQSHPENPFHPGAWNVDWRLSARERNVRAELKRRGFSQFGDKQRHFDRLSIDNELVLNNYGAYELHKCRVVVMQAEKRIAAANVVPFTYHRFPDFPPEIQDTIWEHSLPGPRGISLSDVRKGSAGMLWIREDDNQ